MESGAFSWRFPLKSDLNETWNLVYGAVKSHLSNKRAGGKLFFKSYTGTDIAPLKNFFDVSRVDDSGYMNVNSNYLKLNILDPNIEGTPGVRTNLKLVDYYQYGTDPIPRMQKLDLNTLGWKKNLGNSCSFVEISGFSVQVEKEWIDFNLSKVIRYVLPNKKNVSPLVDPFSIVLTPGYAKLYLKDDELRLRIPICEERVFQAKTNPEEYYLIN